MSEEDFVVFVFAVGVGEPGLIGAVLCVVWAGFALEVEFALGVAVAHANEGVDDVAYSVVAGELFGPLAGFAAP